MKTLFLSPLQPQNAGGGVGGGGGRGGIPASFAGPQALGARAPSPLETWPTGPWGLDPATLTVDFLQAKFFTSCCVSVQVSKRSHNPQSADLGGGWMVSEGGAVQFHKRQGSRLRSSISAAGPGPKPMGTWPTSPSPLNPGQEFQKCPGAHRLMKSLACCTD